MNRFMVSQQRHDVLQDVVIWSRKQYRSRPRLSRSDGKIMPFRRYCAQFYLDPRDARLAGELNPQTDEVGPRPARGSLSEKPGI